MACYSLKTIPMRPTIWPITRLVDLSDHCPLWRNNPRLLFNCFDSVAGHVHDQMTGWRVKYCAHNRPYSIELRISCGVGHCIIAVWELYPWGVRDSNDRFTFDQCYQSSLIFVTLICINESNKVYATTRNKTTQWASQRQEQACMLRIQMHMAQTMGTASW